MDTSLIKYAYVVHTHILGIGDRPFPSLKNVRSVWLPFFKSKRCFLDLESLSCRDRRGEPSPAAPFLHGLGACCFKARSTRLELGSQYEDAAQQICTLMKPHVAYADTDMNADFLFGYGPDITDQRMNYLYLELNKPVFLKAITNDDTQAQGKIFIHIYPTGYIVLQVAIVLTWSSEKNADEIRKIIRETRPWNRYGQWKWISRLSEHAMTISECVREVKRRLQHSFFTNQMIYFAERAMTQPWHTALKGIGNSPTDGQEIAAMLLGLRSQGEALDVEHMKYDPQHGPAFQSWLVCSRQGLALVLHPSHKRKSGLVFFWKTLILVEFMLLQYRIYEDYVQVLQAEITKMKIYRRDLKRKLHEDSLLKLNNYMTSVQELPPVLERHISYASRFHCRLYSALVTGSDVEKYRDTLKKELEAWEKEVDLWEPSLVAIWRKIVKPLWDVFSLVKG